MQYGFFEHFNGSYRGGVLDMHLFKTVAEVYKHTELWLRDYNEEIPHDSLHDLTPIEYRQLKYRKPLIMAGPNVGKLTARLRLISRFYRPPLNRYSVPQKALIETQYRSKVEKSRWLQV
jgi:putative transposase